MKNKKYGFVALRAPSTRWAVDTYALKGAPTNLLVDPEGRIIFRPLLRDAATQRMVELEIEALLPPTANK